MRRKGMSAIGTFGAIVLVVFLVALIIFALGKRFSSGVDVAKVTACKNTKDFDNDKTALDDCPCDWGTTIDQDTYILKSRESCRLVLFQSGTEEKYKNAEDSDLEECYKAASRLAFEQPTGCSQLKKVKEPEEIRNAYKDGFLKSCGDLLIRYASKDVPVKQCHTLESVCDRRMSQSPVCG